MFPKTLYIMYFRVHWKKVQFKYALMLIIKILTKTARKILTRPLASCWPPCASLVSWAASAELEPEAGSGVSNESRNVENYK